MSESERAGIRLHLIAQAIADADCKHFEFLVLEGAQAGLTGSIS